MNDFKHYVWIRKPDGCVRRDKLRKALQRQNIRFKLLVEADGFTLQLSLIEQKLGIALTILRGFAASSFRDRLQIGRIKDFSPKAEYLAPTHQTHQPSRKTHSDREEYHHPPGTQREPGTTYFTALIKVV